jgi:signal transduction histidine kinase
VGLLARLGTTPRDTALAAVFTVAGLVQAVFFPLADGVLGEVFVLGSTLPLAWRRTRPIEAALVSTAFWLIPLDSFPVLGFVVIILQFFAVGAHSESVRAVAAVTVWASLVAVVATLLGPEDPVAAIGGVLVVVAPVLAGRLVHHLHAQNDRLTALGEQLRQERARAEEAAVGAERARIAQELHDVVGHEVTLIAIQAEAASVALARSPERATEPVEAIRETAHRTLTEIRSVLDLLAPADDEGAGVDGLSDLAERARVAGISNTLTETGSPPPDTSPVSLAVRRIVRECLTNAGRHADGQPVSITVDWGRDAVEIDATNATSAATTPIPGRGLTGVRHRTQLLGGSFATQVAEGRFVVRVQIPLGAHP